MNVIIFDFDGTIADSFDAILHITNGLAKEFGFQPAQPEEIKRLQNLTSREIIKQSKIPIFKLPFLLRRLKIELKREIAQLKPISGIRDALMALKLKGYRLGIVTSNSGENVSVFLEKQGLKDLFEFVYTGVTLFGKGRVIQRILQQNHLDRTSVVYVGDETRDIDAAHKIQIKIIAVSWGFNSSQALADHQPDFLIHHPNELLQIVEQLQQPAI